ncbi:MAG: acyltransferase [Rikenellaceae bacterium]|nr:acyltransferase [Rikenellaceae bacterium]
MTDSELQSKTIDFLRFPLIVGVVLIHSQLSGTSIQGQQMMADGDFPLYSEVSYLCSNIIARIAVPLFFFFSGFLFFYRTNGFTKRIYGQKLKKRTRTLLVPYLFWNMLVALLLLLGQTFMPGLGSGANKALADFAPAEWLRIFWNVREAGGEYYPINYPFWFIRDLMVVMLFSPLVYVVVRRFGYYAVALLGVLWWFGWWVPVTGFSAAACFFFTAGAFFSIRDHNFVRTMRPLLPVVAVLYPAMAVGELCLRECAGRITDVLHNANIMVGVILLISLSARLLEQKKGHTVPFLSASSFFIFAYHAIPLGLAIKCMMLWLHPQSDILLLGLYFFCPAVVIALGLTLYCLLQKYLPKFTAVITGGR